MIILFYLLVFFFGLAIGSFLNVIIFRLKTGEGVIKKHSHCLHCGQVLPWYDLIPLASFFVLRGKCRICRKPISWQYPLVELATGFLFLLVFWNFGFRNWNLIGNLSFDIGHFLNIFYYLFIINCLMIIFVYDFKNYIIPDKVLLPAIIISLAYRFFEIQNLIGHWELKIENWQTFFSYIVTAGGGAVFFLSLVLITRGRGMGWGDVKLVFLMGLVLGWPKIIFAFFLAFAAGALIGISLIIARRKTLKSQIPFGPFLAAVTVLMMFFGDKISDWCFAFLGF